MLKIELNKKVRRCDHCGTRNIKRSFRIYNDTNQIFIGRVCLQRELNINTSGNPNRAIKRLQSYLDNLSEDELEYIWGLAND